MIAESPLSLINYNVHAARSELDSVKREYAKNRDYLQCTAAEIQWKNRYDRNILGDRGSSARRGYIVAIHQ
uniref:SCP domain-containing protein n=1 Tax=Steinernema glaseri TaxID=37863 RepID=A0A1I8A9G2_9BILA